MRLFDAIGEVLYCKINTDGVIDHRFRKRVEIIECFSQAKSKLPLLLSKIIKEKQFVKKSTLAICSEFLEIICLLCAT